MTLDHVPALQWTHAPHVFKHTIWRTVTHC